MSDEMTATIDEAARRWPDWQGGRPIVLPDEQTWWFYEPEARVRAGQPGWTFGPDVAPDVDAILSHRFGKILRKWERAESDAGRTSVMLEAAWFLLARNYAVKQDEFEAIMLRGAEWDGDRRATLGRALLFVVATACMRASGLAEAG